MTLRVLAYWVVNIGFDCTYGPMAGEQVNKRFEFSRVHVSVAHALM